MNAKSDAEHQKNEKIQKIKQLIHNEQQKSHEVYAIATGCPVRFSSSYNNDHDKYFLDHDQGYAPAWCAAVSQVGEWIQVSSPVPRYWTHLIMQGRGKEEKQWVSSIKVCSTLNGQYWQSVDQGKIFSACQDPQTKIKIFFSQPVYARVLRIYPQSWHGHLSLRFEAVYIDLE